MQRGWIGICREDTAPDPGRYVLIPLISPGSNCPQQCRFQAMTGTDGSAGRTRLQTCIEGSVAWDHRDPAGTNSWLLGTGGRGRLRDNASGLSTFPWVSEQVESNQSEFQFSLLSLWTAVFQRVISWEQVRVNTQLVFWGETEIPPQPPSILRKLGCSFIRQSWCFSPIQIHSKARKKNECIFNF